MSFFFFFFFFGLQIWNVLIYFFLIDIWSHTGLYFSPGAHSGEYSRSLVGGKCDGRILRIRVWFLFFFFLNHRFGMYLYFFFLIDRIQDYIFPQTHILGNIRNLVGGKCDGKIFRIRVWFFFLNRRLNAYTTILFLRHTSWGIFAKFCCCCCWKITEEF